MEGRKTEMEGRMGRKGEEEGREMDNEIRKKRGKRRLSVRGGRKEEEDMNKGKWRGKEEWEG